MSKVKNILIRADSSSEIGIGHIMRDLVLAKQYSEADITFASLNQMKVFDTKRLAYKSGNISKDDFEMLKLKMQDFIQVTPHSKKNGRGITSKDRGSE